MQKNCCELQGCSHGGCGADKGTSRTVCKNFEKFFAPSVEQGRKPIVVGFFP